MVDVFLLLQISELAVTKPAAGRVLQNIDLKFAFFD